MCFACGVLWGWRRTRARQARWWAVEVLDEDNEWTDFMVRHAARKDAREYALDVAKDLPELRLRVVSVVERRVTVEKVKPGSPTDGTHGQTPHNPTTKAQ